LGQTVQRPGLVPPQAVKKFPGSHDPKSHAFILHAGPDQYVLGSGCSAQSTQVPGLGPPHPETKYPAGQAGWELHGVQYQGEVGVGLFKKVPEGHLGTQTSEGLTTE
jgi:hypothetical protein